MDPRNRALVEALMRRQIPSLFVGVPASAEPPPERDTWVVRAARSPVADSIMNAFTGTAKGVADAVTLPGDVLRGHYSLPSMDTPGISEDDGYNVYRDGRYIGNRLANQEGMIKRATGLSGTFTGSGVATTAAQGRRAMMDPNVVRMGGGAGRKLPRRYVQYGGKEYLTASDGSVDFGRIGREVSEATGRLLPEGAIRIEKGIPGEKGYGALHIAPDRHADAVSLGYADAFDLMEDVSRSYDAVVQQQNGRLMLVKKNGRHRYAIMELIPGPDAYYGMTTGFFDGKRNSRNPDRTSLNREIQLRGGKLLWER